MAKNKNAKTAKKEEVKKVVTPVTEPETKKEETPQVAAETVTEAPKQEKPQPKKEEKPVEKKEPKKKEKTPTLVPEEVDDLPKKLNIPANVAVGATSSSFDGKSQLAFVMQQRYANPEVQKNYPEFFAAMSHNIDVVVLLALNDLRNEMATRAESGELKLTVTPDQLIRLNEAASMLGIELAPAKALPGATDGQLAINFNESKIPEELKEVVPEKKEVELDPKKVQTTDMLIEALEHLMTASATSPAEKITNTLAWYRTYCMNQEEDAEKKLALDERTVGDWIDEIFSLIKPTVTLNGIGGACYTYTAQMESPVMAHCILHSYFSKLNWSEEEIAELVKCFTKGKYRLKVQEGLVDKPEENKALKAISGILGLPYIDKVFKDLDSNDEASRTTARRIVGLIRTNYFPKEKNEAPSADALRARLGQIINLYRDPMDRLAVFAQAEGEYPEPAKKEETEKKN